MDNKKYHVADNHNNSIVMTAIDNTNNKVICYSHKEADIVAGILGYFCKKHTNKIDVSICGTEDEKRTKYMLAKANLAYRDVCYVTEHYMDYASVQEMETL